MQEALWRTMEQIISKLSEIENMAGQIMEEAQDKKKELSQQHQNQCRKYDEQAQAQAEEKIRQIRVQLEQNQKTQLADLKKRTQEGFAQMEDYYEKQHQRLAREIYEKIIQT